MSISSMGSGGSTSGGSVDQGGSTTNPRGDVIGKNGLVAVEWFYSICVDVNGNHVTMCCRRGRETP